VILGSKGAVPGNFTISTNILQEAICTLFVYKSDEK
jgi:hypothetical protein